MPELNLQHFCNEARPDNFVDGVGFQVVAGRHRSRHVSGSRGQQHCLARARPGPDSDLVPGCVLPHEVRSGAASAASGKQGCRVSRAHTQG